MELLYYALQEKDIYMRLPETFLYGATIGAHQVEGEDFESDWWRWEQRPSRICDGETSERGAGHLTHYEADLDLARKLGHNAVSLSLSWPRIHPEIDRFDDKALDHYKQVFEYAQHCSLTPVCVLHEVTQPHWFHKAGGWCAPNSVSVFQQYAQHVMEALGNRCRHWVPVYEPEFWLTRVYREHCWPGWEKGGYRAYRKSLRHLVTAQRLVAATIHEADPGAQVGLSIRGAVVTPMDPYSPWDARMARREQHRLNLRFLEAVTIENNGDNDFMDFIGLQFSGALRMRFAPLNLRGGCALPVDANGQLASMESFVPDKNALDEVLAVFGVLNKPIYLTLSGDVADDGERCRFLCDHFQALLHTMHHYEESLKVQALFFATLLDGFEWQHGYTRCNGLVHVKHPVLERTPNPSAWFFKDIAEHGCIREGIAEKFCNEKQGNQQ